MLFNLFSPVAPDPSVPYVPGVSNVAFTIGSLSIDWYGIFITIGEFLLLLLVLDFGRVVLAMVIGMNFSYFEEED